VDTHGSSVPEGWEVSAWSDEPADDPDAPGARVVMGLRKPGPVNNPAASVEGVQFHPECFMTTEGPLLLANFLGVERPTVESLVP